MTRPIWFKGTCDLLLIKVRTWHEKYDSGVCHSTCQYMNEQGKIVPKVTKRAHTIAFSKGEIDNLLLMSEYYCNNEGLKQEIRMVCEDWQKNGRLTNQGLRKITLVFYPEYVKAIYDMLSKAKREHLAGGSIEELIQKSKDTGKDLFEM